FPVQARFFAGVNSVKPDTLNPVLQTDGLKKMDALGRYGFEANYPVLNFLDVGLRYTKRTQQSDQDPANSSTNYFSKLDQDSLALLARFSVLKTDIVRVDVFGGFGGSNTTLTLKTATEDGMYTRKAATGWFATPYTAAGASLALGFKQFFVYFEGGVETNKVTGFERSGTLSNNIDTVDLSGSYFSIGLMFDGVPGSFK
ncbi:MAG: hypothetical protein ACXVCP_18035, partial [Bdellovibrio sp.]